MFSGSCKNAVDSSLVTPMCQLRLGARLRRRSRGAWFLQPPADPPFLVMAMVAPLAILTARRIAHFPQPHKVN